MAKLLSICITSFNRKDAIERLLAQLELVATPHLRDVEVCITDNCSTDGSWELFTQLKQKTRLDLHLSRNNTNIGFDANYLKSIQMGTGQWVWTCGDDDYPAHAGFEALLAALKSGNYTDAPFLVFQSVTPKCYLFRDNQSPPASSSQVFIGKKELLESTPGFVSVIVYNNNQFKSLCASDPKSVNEGIGTLYMHTWLLQLLGCALRETEDKKPQAVAQNKNPQVPAHKTGKQAAPVRLSDVLVVETRSATHIKDANRQLLFMFDTLKIHILNVKFSLLGKYFGRENLPMFFRQLASRYFRAVFNIILARKFRKAGFDMPIAKHLVASHPFAFPLLLLPYAAITLLPVLFSRATYVLFKNLLLIIHATTEYEVHLSESRWKP